MTEEITLAEIRTILARCNAASPGPWKSFIEGRDHSSVSSESLATISSSRGRLTKTKTSLQMQDKMYCAWFLKSQGFAGGHYEIVANNRFHATGYAGA